MDYLSTVRVLDTDYKIKDEEAARIKHTHKVDEIDGAAKEGHKHQASEIAGLSTVATSGSYSDLSGKPSAATESADGLMTSSDKKKLDGIAAGAQANAVESVNGKTGAVTLGASDVGAASASHTHSASQVSGLATVATSGKYADLTGAPSSMKNPAALTVQANGETVATYDGSSAATANITPENIGAAPSSHTHNSIDMLAGRPVTANIASSGDKRVNVMMATSSMTEGKPGEDGYIINFNWDNSWWATQVFVPDVITFPLKYRVRRPSGNSFSWSEWSEIYSETNAHKASVGSAAKLSTARTINLTGAVSGSAEFDGSGNVSISTTANESYISSPISGLYNMAVDADGNLWVYHSDSDKAPNFEYDSATGNLYYVTEA